MIPLDIDPALEADGYTGPKLETWQTAAALAVLFLVTVLTCYALDARSLASDASPLLNSQGVGGEACAEKSDVPTRPAAATVTSGWLRVI